MFAEIFEVKKKPKQVQGKSVRTAMTVDERFRYVDHLAMRGLQIFLFDGRTLVLSYNENGDARSRRAASEDHSELVAYASDLLDLLPKAARMFPGLTEIEIEYS